MRGPGELVDRLDPVKAIAALDQEARIPRETCGMAGDGHYPQHLARRDFPRLLARTLPRWVEDHHVESGQLVRSQRLAHQVPLLDHDRAGQSAPPCGSPEAGERRRVPFHRRHGGPFGQRKSETAAACVEIGDALRPFGQGFQNRLHQRLLPLPRRLQETARRRVDRDLSEGKNGGFAFEQPFRLDLLVRRPAQARDLLFASKLHELFPRHQIRRPRRDEQEVEAVFRVQQKNIAKRLARQRPFQELPERLQERKKLGRQQQAGLKIDDRPAVALVEAQFEPAATAPEG